MHPRFGFYCAMAALAAAALPVRAADSPAPVTVGEDNKYYLLSNGIITAKVSKTSGNLDSLIYRDVETMGHGAGHPAGYWEEEPSLAPDLTHHLTIDPAKNGGARAEVSIKGVTGGTVMLTPDAPGGGTYCDIEIRYTLGRGESGIYTYAIFSHPQSYGPMDINESRFGLKLSNVWDWLSIDAERNKQMPTPADWDAGTELNMKEVRQLNTGIYKGTVEHKYDYSAQQFKIPAFGWSSTTKHIGIWMINPTIEFLSGGAGKVELTGHLDTGTGGIPILLDYWRGTHYGSADCTMAAGENWSKVVGPIYLYLNHIEQPQAAQDDALAMWHDALAQAAKENTLWPYAWVQGVDYPLANERGTVTGRLVLNDPQAKTTKLPNLLVGLAHADYSVSGRGGRVIDWQHDAKFYQFWVNGNEDGTFSIPKVRPGTYTLHAYADGVLGEYAQADVTVTAGQTIDLGKINWQPVRYGKQLWDIGVANRSGTEFFDGANYWHWGWYLQYPKLFPNDVTYTIGQSDYRKDWFFEQVPHAAAYDYNQPGAETPWTIKFNLDHAPKGAAVLRLAFSGADTGRLRVTVNGQEAGTVTGIQNTGVVHRDGMGGAWQAKDLTFDASLMKQGENTMQLILPAGSVTNGLIYDYLRLELNEQSSVDGKPL